jgi:hypothetical protein
MVVATLCIVAMFGCAGKSPNADKSKEGIQPVPPEFFNPYYPSHAVTIEPGDVLTVRFYYHPELDSSQAVRPDGKISLTLFQGIDVAGKSPEELQRHLTEVYAKEFVDPVISVEIEKKSTPRSSSPARWPRGGSSPCKSNSPWDRSAPKRRSGTRCGPRQRGIGAQHGIRITPCTKSTPGS